MPSKRFRRGAVAVAIVAFVLTYLPRSAAPADAATCPTSLSFGATAACTLDKTTEVDSFGLSASAGDAVFVHVVGASGSGLEVDFDVRDPSGATACSASAGSSAEAVCKLQTTGKYTVSVFDAGHDDTGGYRIDAQRINRPVGAFALAMARPRQGLIGIGENDWYTFVGVANAVVVARATVLGASTMDADLDVFAPNGDTVCGTRAGVTAQAACTLPSAATYTVRVDDSADDEAGAYALTVRPECTITGTTGADTIVGTTGPDVICALGGNDKISGGDGNDVILGGTGDDALDGGAGSDVFLSEKTADGADTVTGGTATDVLSYIERSSAVSADADVVADDGEANEHDDVRADVETLLGGAGNDRLTGGSLNNTLVGGFGDDAVDGGGGNDAFLANADPDGADTFVGGTGADQVSYADRSVAVQADPDAASDDGASGERDNIAADVEGLVGGSGNDVLTGGPGADVISGGAGNDLLDGNNGDDRINGDAGADTFVVRPHDGADVISGGSATDSISYAVRTAAVAVSLDGVANDGEVNEHDDIRTDVENVTGGSGSDSITGTAAANRLDGGAGNDTLRGGAGDDTLIGGPGYDTLDGGDGVDRCDPGADGARVDYCDRS